MSALLLPQHTVLPKQFHTNTALWGQAAPPACSISKASHTAQCLAQRISYPQPCGSLHDASSLHPTSCGLNLPLGQMWNLPQPYPWCTAHLHIHSQASSVMQTLHPAPTGIPPLALGFPTSLLPLVLSQTLQELGTSAAQQYPVFHILLPLPQAVTQKAKFCTVRCTNLF